MYIQPLPLTLWLWTGLTLLAAISMVIGVSMTREGGGASWWAALKWCVRWAYGASLEQVVEPILPASTGKTPAHEIKINLKWMLLSILGLLCLLNNVYQAVLNLNYVTGADLLSPGHRIYELSTANFSHIYIALSRGFAWKAKENYGLDGDVSVMHWGALAVTCDQKSKYDYDYIPPVDQAACFLQAEIDVVVNMRADSGNGNCYDLSD